MAQWLGALTALPEDQGADSYHTHGSPQPSVTPALGDPMPTSSLEGYQAHIRCTDTHASNTLLIIMHKVK